MQGFHLHYDHGDVYNFAKEWFRIKSVSKDSVVPCSVCLSKTKKLQRTSVLMLTSLFIRRDYIKNTLKTTAAVLQRPTAKDTAFIRELSAIANRNPTNRDSVFAGRQPAQLIPQSELITVKKISSVDPLNGKTEAYDYLYPNFRIVIQKAYKDFGYSFTMMVDEKGKLHLGTFSGHIPEYYEVRKKVLEGIIEVYLQNLLIVKPGTTLGIPHASEVSVSVKGVK